MDPKPDVIEIRDLEISARVGVPDEERAAAQRLTVSVTLQPRGSFSDLGDDLAQTIDYAAVCDALQQLAISREVRLIETLAHAMAAQLLAQFPIVRVELELRKFILSQTKYVAVRVVREAAGDAEN
ncbi:MAG: dihydroneopterin aldolase [Chthoniobacterales bacterium]